MGGTTESNVPEWVLDKVSTCGYDCVSVSPCMRVHECVVMCANYVAHRKMGWYLPDTSAASLWCHCVYSKEDLLQRPWKPLMWLCVRYNASGIRTYQHFPLKLCFLPFLRQWHFLTRARLPHTTALGVFDHTVILSLATMPLAIGQLPWEVWLPLCGIEGHRWKAYGANYCM